MKRGTAAALACWPEVSVVTFLVLPAHSKPSQKDQRVSCVLIRHDTGYAGECLDRVCLHLAFLGSLTAATCRSRPRMLPVRSKDIANWKNGWYSMT